VIGVDRWFLRGRRSFRSPIEIAIFATETEEILQNFPSPALKMWTILLIIFVVCLVHDYVEEGGSFVLFSRLVEIGNSFRASTPRKPTMLKGCMLVEYKFGNRLYGQIIPYPSAPRKWSKVGTLIDDVWTDVTQEVIYFAGPGKDFGGAPLKPEHINESYTILSFAYNEKDVVHVRKGEVILSKLPEDLPRK
jgi:hypothetical protein